MKNVWNEGNSNLNYLRELLIFVVQLKKLKNFLQLWWLLYLIKDQPFLT
jgi:hypothetical protein